MTKEEMAAWAAQLSVKAARARSWSRSLQAEVARVAREVAETEDAMAATMERLAAQHPHSAERFRDLGRAAREHAALERRLRREYLGALARNDSAG
jgi:hypothetical protein